MKKNIKKLQELENFFAEEPSLEEKAWDIVHDFLHTLQKKMDLNGINQSDLAERMGVSRSAVSQLLNGSPANISIKKMVELSEAAELVLKFDIEKTTLFVEEEVQIYYEVPYFIVSRKASFHPDTYSSGKDFTPSDKIISFDPPLVVRA